jgi:hypothetical protein
MGVLNDAPVILRNNGTANHWLGLSLVGSKSNRDGIGVRVVVTDNNARKQIFDVSTSSSYLSANDGRLIVGLGQAVGVKSIEIRWPSGQVQMISDPKLQQYLTVKEDSSH